MLPPGASSQVLSAGDPTTSTCQTLPPGPPARCFQPDSFTRHSHQGLPPGAPTRDVKVSDRISARLRGQLLNAQSNPYYKSNVCRPISPHKLV